MSSTGSFTHSIFEEPWWLDAVAPGQWDSVEIDEHGTLAARLPYVVRDRAGIRLLGQPALTQTLGPWIAPRHESVSERLAREKDLFARLIDRLPKHDAFRQNFHSDVTNWLPFYWQGFSQSTRYSYVLDDLSDLDVIFAGMRKSTRKQIHRAEKAVQVVEADGVDEVLKMAKMTFARQGLSVPYPPDLLHRIDEAAKRFAYRKALYAVDDSGRIHSAVYTVGDARRVYSLVSGNNPELRKSHAGALLRWEAIKHAAQQSRVFDFEGSMIEGVEEFYRSFGTRQSQYSHVSRSNRKASWGRLVSRLAR